MLASFQRRCYSLLDIVTLNVHAIVVMHAATVALLLHGVLLASLAGLIIRFNFSAQTLLLIGLLLNIHPKLLSYIQILPDGIQELSHRVEDAHVVPIIEETRASMHREATPHIEDRSRCRAASVDNLRFGYTSIIDKGNLTIIEPERPRTPYTPKRKLRKSVRDRGTFDDNKENEPSPMRPLTEATLSISHHNGLRPLTLTNNPSLDVKDSVGLRRTVSLFNGAKRSSSLLYVSDGAREHSRPLQPEVSSVRRASLPPDGLSCVGMDVSARLQGEIRLTSKLHEEMKLTARLRNDLVELRDRTCAELNQSKHEAQALAVAVDARECFIKDLAASVEFLRVENKVLKKANRRDLCQDVPAETFTGRTIDENMQRFSPNIKTWERRQEYVSIANTFSKESGGSKSAREKRLRQRYVKRSSITAGDLSGIGWGRGEDSFNGDTASWLSFGTVSEPTLEPPRNSRASLQVSPPTFTSDAEYCECAIDTPEGYLEVEFPTISPEFPPCHVAALACKKVVVPSKGMVAIYEVDGRALAPFDKRLPPFQFPTAPVLLRYSMYPGATRNSPRHSRADTTCLASNQNYRGEASYLAMQRDSAFYAVPASAFIVPRAVV